MGWTVPEASLETTESKAVEVVCHGPLRAGLGLAESTERVEAGCE
jgi:hypothetical protein